MSDFKIQQVSSLGIMPTYQCSNQCRHCLYASSPSYKEWMDDDTLDTILKELKKYSQYLTGIHIGGGESLLKVDRTADLIRKITDINLPLEYVETNAFWCWNDEKTESVFLKLKEAGLRAVLISVSPFHLEYVPFEKTERAVEFAKKIFGVHGVLIYTPYYYQQFQGLEDHKQTLPFEDYLGAIGLEEVSLQIASEYSLIPNGRAGTVLRSIFEHHPAQRFFGETCQKELSSPHHLHIDCYGNYIAGLCAGITLGDARDLDSIYQGIDLTEKPVLRNLVLGGVEFLLHWAKENAGYEERPRGYVAKCDLCLDIRRHLVQAGKFDELQPKQFYENLD